MSEIVRIAEIHNEVEAAKIESFCKEDGLVFNIRTFSDSAYDGIFESATGWGYIEAPEQFRDQILAIVENVRDYDPEVVQQKESTSDFPSTALKWIVIFGAVIIVIFSVFLYLGRKSNFSLRVFTSKKSPRTQLVWWWRGDQLVSRMPGSSELRTRLTDRV